MCFLKEKDLGKNTANIRIHQIVGRGGRVWLSKRWGSRERDSPLE